MESRNFIVIHTLGAQWVKASCAASAVRMCSVPGGYRHVRGLVAAANVGDGGGDGNPVLTHPADAPFIAFIGQPV